jgi:hypothetical protein
VRLLPVLGFVALSGCVYAEIHDCAEDPSDPRCDAGGVDGGRRDAGRVDGGRSDAAGIDGGPPADAPFDSGVDPRTDAGSELGIHIVSPMSTSRVTTRRPRIRWMPAAGVSDAEVIFCSDRECGEVLQKAAGTDEAFPTDDLPPGVVFFFVIGARPDMPALRSPTYEIVVPHTSAAHDTAWGTFPDFDGDGVADLAATAPGVAGGGRVLVWYGSGGSPDREPDEEIGASDAFTAVGSSVSSAGDVNADGYGDLVVGQRLNSGVDLHSIFAVYHGGPGGLEASPRTVSNVGSLGTHVLGVGDFDGDGFGDVAASSEPFAIPQMAAVFAGGPAGITASQLAGGPVHAGDVSFGGPLAAGDFDGDRLGDLAVSAFANSFAEGRLYVYRYLRETPITEPTPGARNHWAQGISALDANGDGFCDLAVTELNGVNRIHFLRGATSIFSVVETFEPASPQFSPIVSSAGDMDADGYEDLLVDVGTNGAAVVRGGQDFSAPLVLLSPPAECTGGCIFGPSLGALGDFDGDAIDDFVVAAPASSLLSVFHGNAPSPPRRVDTIVRTDFPQLGTALTRR